ncbi:MAG: B12-binding domain-containing radical SAM protein, partial [Mesorhizobium sp.]
MKVALVNPRWTYEHSIYFGCRQPHLPLELGYCKALLETDGHSVLMLDGQLQDLDNAELAERVAAFAPDMTVVTTAPTYLFWRCAPPELRVPAEFLKHLAGRGEWSAVPHTARLESGVLACNGGVSVSRFVDHPALHW